MTQLRTYTRATVEFSDDDEAALSMLMTRTNSEGEIVDKPPRFPLDRAHVVFNGNQATVSIQQANRKHKRVCRLTEASLTEPRKAGDPVVIEGTAHELVANGFKAEDSRIRAIITSYATCATCR